MQAPWWAPYYSAPAVPAVQPYNNGLVPPVVQHSVANVLLPEPAPPVLQPAPPAKTCLAARNFMNTQYTVPVRVNGTQFWLVPDSGSFEVVLPAR